MADKHLTELEWKRFAKGKDLKDAAFAKALAALEKTGSGADDVAALEEVERQSQALRKGAKGDKAVAGYLDELDDTLGKRLQSARAAAKTRASKAGGKGGEDAAEDEDSPAALTTGLVPLLRQVQKGTTLHSMILTDGGKATAVMLSRREIATTRSKLLKEYLGISAAKPPIVGQCLFEANMITFVVPAEVAGMAKKIKAALLAQTEMRWKVRVRGLDPNVVDEDDESDVADVAAAAQPETVPPAPPEPPAQDLAPLLAAMGKLRPGIQQVAAARPALKGDLLAQVAAFQAAVQRADAAGAREQLFALAAQVKRIQGELGEAGASAGVVQFEQIHLEWDGAKKAVHERLVSLNAAILADGDDDESRTAAAKLDRVLARFNEGLGDTLDALRNAAPAARGGLAAKAQGIADRYLDYLASDPLVAHVERNPYDIDVGAREQLSSRLNALKGELARIGG